MGSRCWCCWVAGRGVQGEVRLFFGEGRWVDAVGNGSQLMPTRCICLTIHAFCSQANSVYGALRAMETLAQLTRRRALAPSSPDNGSTGSSASGSSGGTSEGEGGLAEDAVPEEAVWPGGCHAGNGGCTGTAWVWLRCSVTSKGRTGLV